MAMDIGTRWELMTDDFLTDRLEGAAAFRLHSPVPRETIAAFDAHQPAPGESAAGEHTQLGVGAVFRDGDRYRMYYGVLRNRYHDGTKTVTDARHCYAESADGIAWTLPRLGLCEYKGSKDNNILGLGDPEDVSRDPGPTGAVFKDPNPDCPPEHRYKTLGRANREKADLPNELWALSSPDGLRWRVYGSGPIMRGGPGRGRFDSFNLAFWDGVRGEYRLYRREVYLEGPKYVGTDGQPVRETKTRGYRDILTATSADFLHWTEPRRLRYGGVPPQRRDAPPEQLYTNHVIPYFRAPHIFVGFPRRYVEHIWGEAVVDLPQPERRRAIMEQGGVLRRGTAVTDTLFMSSRNGHDFKLWDEAFVPPGPSLTDNWFYADNTPNWGLVTTPSHIPGAPDELSFYVTEGMKIEGRCNAIRRHTLRIDGFVSLRAERAGGELTTKPLLFKGDSLAVNFAASAAGSVRVEIQDERGWPIPGFEMESNVPLLGDDLERRVRWKDAPDPGRLAGVPVRLRFRLADADLYAFGFRENRT